MLTVSPFALVSRGGPVWPLIWVKLESYIWSLKYVPWKYEVTPVSCLQTSDCILDTKTAQLSMKHSLYLMLFVNILNI